MRNINKLDFFVGVFLARIINSSSSVPALFEETENSKRIEFTTDTDDFNVYVKYSQRISTSSLKGRKKRSWTIGFSKNEYSALKESFYSEDRKNLICLVCTNQKLNETYLVVLSYKEAMKCLESNINGSRRITVTRTGADHNFICYGAGPEMQRYSTKCPVDRAKSLGLKEEELV
ncbi:MAG: hypothetical protein GX957_01910 [Clostridiaceae bacterium]|nr:hypothetical protein [Clostridiaceae bacterium]